MSDVLTYTLGGIVVSCVSGGIGILVGTFNKVSNNTCLIAICFSLKTMISNNNYLKVFYNFFF